MLKSKEGVVLSTFAAAVPDSIKKEEVRSFFFLLQVPYGNKFIPRNDAML
jgi:hypothetical protein